MKIVKPVWLIVLPFVLLIACSKKEVEENKPAAPAQVPEEIIEPNPDQIRKVIRYNNAGGVQDSVLFKYDSKNRVSRIEFGPINYGRFENKIDFSYSYSSNWNSNIIFEQDSTLNASGQYYFNSSATYSVKGNYKNASLIDVQYPLRYSVTYDSLGYVKGVRQTGYKSSDWFMHTNFQSQNNNLTAANTDSDPMGTDRASYEYYPEPYNHDLNFNFSGVGIRYFWNRSLFDLFNFRHSFLGRRNSNLVKKQTTLTETGVSEEITYQYEFNFLGLVSKIKTATVSSKYGATPMTTKYELFYY